MSGVGRLCREKGCARLFMTWILLVSKDLEYSELSQDRQAVSHAT